MYKITKWEKALADAARKFKHEGKNLHPTWVELLKVAGNRWNAATSEDIAKTLRTVRNYIEDEFSIYCVLVGQSYYEEKSWRKKGQLNWESATKHIARKGNPACGMYFPKEQDENLLLANCKDYSRRSRTYDIRARRKTRMAIATNLLSHEAVNRHKLLNGS
jgi:hypothetical protein